MEISSVESYYSSTQYPNNEISTSPPIENSETLPPQEPGVGQNIDIIG